LWGCCCMTGAVSSLWPLVVLLLLLLGKARQVCTFEDREQLKTLNPARERL
jgi:hypothetical protein